MEWTNYVAEKIWRNSVFRGNSSGRFLHGPPLNIKDTRFFDSNYSILHSVNLFNVTPELTQAAISKKPDKESLTPPPPLNPSFLTPPPTVETPSQQGPKRKRRRIQFVNYLDDHKSHGKQLKKHRHKKFKPYKYSMGEEEED